MKADLAVTGGTLVEPGVGVFRGDIACVGGRIAAITEPGAVTDAKRTVSAEDMFVLPGIFDPHIHVGIYQDFESDCRTETQAAISGGVTTVGVHMHAHGSYLDAIHDMARTFNRHALADVKLHVTIQDERHVQDLPTLSARFGINSFKFYLAGIPNVLTATDDWTLLDAFRRIGQLDGRNLACVHAENEDIVTRATQRVRESVAAPDLADWESARPGLCEAEAVARASYLAAEAGCELYIVHLSSAAGARMLRTARPSPGFVETTSPYLTCSLEDFDQKDLSAKHLPPLRRGAELDELWAAVADDRIDTIGTDHIAIARAKKLAAPSILDVITAGPFIETHLPAVLTEGHVQRGIPLEKLVAKMTANPARAFGLYPRKGSLRVGADADIAVIDLQSKRAVRAAECYGSSDFSLIEGRELTGWPTHVVKGGKLAYADGQVLEDSIRGKVLSSVLGEV